MIEKEGKGSMPLNHKLLGQIGRIAIVVIVWSCCFVVLSIMLDFMLDSYFRGDGEACFAWLLALDKRFLAYAAICWLIFGALVAVAKLPDCFKGRVKQVANSLLTRGFIK